MKNKFDISNFKIVEVTGKFGNSSKTTEINFVSNKYKYSNEECLKIIKTIFPNGECFIPCSPYGEIPKYLNDKLNSLNHKQSNGKKYGYIILKDSIFVTEIIT